MNRKKKKTREPSSRLRHVFSFIICKMYATKGNPALLYFPPVCKITKNDNFFIPRTVEF